MVYARQARPRATLVVVCSLLIPVSDAGALDLDTGTYRDAKLGVKLDVPEGWTLHRHTGYPSLLLILTRGQEASISLSTARFPPNQTMQRFIADNRRGLLAVGFRVFDQKRVMESGRLSWKIRARTRDGAKEVRQRYLPHGTRVFIVTLSCPSRKAEHYNFDLNQTLEALELRQPERRRRPSDRIDQPSKNGLMPIESPPKSSPDVSIEGEIGGEQTKPVKRKGVDTRPNVDRDSSVDSRPNPTPTSKPVDRPTSKPLPDS